LLFGLSESDRDAATNILVEVGVVDNYTCTIFTEVYKITAAVHALHLERECIDEFLLWLAFISEFLV